MSYRKDIKAAWERVQAVPSRTVDSSLGPVEYTLEGEGPPLFMSHGIQGSHAKVSTWWDVRRDRLDGHRAIALRLFRLSSAQRRHTGASSRRLRRTPRPAEADTIREVGESMAPSS